MRALSAVTLLEELLGLDNWLFFVPVTQDLLRSWPCWSVPRLAEAWQLGCGHWHWSGWLLLETLFSLGLLDRKLLSNPGQEMANLIHFLKLGII